MSEGLPTPPNIQKSPILEGTKKRNYVLWETPEIELFVSGLDKFGRDFEKIQQHIKTKTISQVRHFYYRNIKKINVILEPFLQGAKFKNFSGMDKLVKHYLNVRYSAKDDNYKANLLDYFSKNFISDLAYMTMNDYQLTMNNNNCGVGGNMGVNINMSNMNNYNMNIKNFDINNTNNQMPGRMMSPLNNNNNTVQSIINTNNVNTHNHNQNQKNIRSPPHSKKPTKRAHSECFPEDVTLTLQLFPRNVNISSMITSISCNPLLQMSFKMSKSISTIIKYIQKKWKKAILNNYEIVLYPKHVDDHYGWSVEDTSLTMQQIYDEFNYSYTEIFQLFYSIEEKIENRLQNSLMKTNDERLSASHNSLKREESLNLSDLLLGGKSNDFPLENFGSKLTSTSSNSGSECENEFTSANNNNNLANIKKDDTSSSSSSSSMQQKKIQLFDEEISTDHFTSMVNQKYEQQCNDYCKNFDGSIDFAFIDPLIKNSTDEKEKSKSAKEPPMKKKRYFGPKVLC